MDVLIVGAGAVGRWVATVLDGPVAFADADEDAAVNAAAERSDARAVPLDGDQTFDVVCVAVPMRAATDVIETQADRANRALVDCTGSMEAPLDVMASVAPDLERVSYHPLFAPEHAPGRIAVSTGEGGPTTDALTAAFEAADNELVTVSATEHDEAMRTIQGRTHAAILAFGLAAEEVPDELSTPVFADLEALRDRVTGGTPGVYADIQDVFDGAEAIAAAASQIADADREAFAALYDDAR
ncbi:Prephenate dehydrogenase [Halanaeroarchaeum sp. HSR-CO]|uniref:prephenate dehydrogenase/arogenate dehydrogenase family protein n=1 Tax=Halanaeroarchaeum sp. HSR-CO TaxID=2866382 RepID=UPI00217D5F19|nr:prephenate dehydrogenase/arogenate dehydrogenase family protein [Halanaeroarchaeum sp. HSR-CO]UWG48316.1 Prephenate dehydrogenase [Halanaeroarchaeum sp. HSR-CO]